jgi:hypothetical protein
LLFVDQLDKLARDQDLDIRSRNYASHVISVAKDTVDEMLREATNSADNFPEYL